MVVTESEWTYSHRHSTVVAIHRWSNGRTDRQSGRGVTESQTWRESRLVVGQCLWMECQWEPLSAISSISFEKRNSCCFENSLHNKIAFLTRWKNWNIKPTNVLPEVPLMFNSVILEVSKPNFENFNKKIIQNKPSKTKISYCMCSAAWFLISLIKIWLMMTHAMINVISWLWSLFSIFSHLHLAQAPNETRI